jgi:serine/threonine protein kinase/Tfp pilus assembly protein PilF
MIGKTISHYRILEKLGEGGMGVVYKAEDTKLRRPVALKFLPPELTRDPEAKERFIQEAQAASALDHPNICNIHEIDETSDGQLFICMAYYEGETLKEKIKRGPLDVRTAIGIAMQVGQGLAKAHSHGIVHRDIKPANIVVTDEGVAKILDFGLAKLAGQIRLTKASSTLGTVAYMSPEQAGGKEIDRRTDVWSLGVVLFEMLTGRLPFKGEYEQAMMYSIMNEAAMALGTLRPDMPKELQAIFDKALAKSSDNRYQHVNEMIADLESSARRLDAMSPALAADASEALRRRGRYAVIGIGIVAVAALILGKLFLFGPHERPIASIAVLPFQNLSADPEQEYFSDGMTEALIAELSKIKALRVISRTSVMRFKKSERSLPEIARQLNVDAVIEGSVQRVQDDVRVTAQLVRGAPEKHLWANTYTQSYRNILALESDIARAIAREIQVTVTPDEEKRLAASHPVNPEAHEAYLKGLYYLNKVTGSDVKRAQQYFEESISIDSSYALPYVGLADVYDYFAAVNPQEAAPKMSAYAHKALSLDPTNAKAYAILADIEMYSWNWAAAEANFKRALELNPNDPTVRSYYSNFLMIVGRSDEALAQAQRACELDPLSAGLSTGLAYIHITRREYDRADSLVAEVLSMDSTFALAHQARGRILLERGQYDEAASEFREAVDRGDPSSVPGLAAALARSGKEAEARQILAYGIKMRNTGYQLGTSVAAVYLAFGERDSAFVWLDKAFERREAMLPWIRAGAWFDPIRSDPRYVALMRKVGLEP